MQRRRFFGGLTAAVAGFFGVKTASASEAPISGLAVSREAIEREYRRLGEMVVDPATHPLQYTQALGAMYAFCWLLDDLKDSANSQPPSEVIVKDPKYFLYALTRYKSYQKGDWPIGSADRS